MLVAPKNVPLNWYQYDVSFSVELLQSYIEDIEKQISSSVEAYRNKTGTEFVEETYDEQNSSEIEIHKGLDDQTWNLKEIFEEYFPNLQRSSALLTLFSFLEKELDGLCKLFQKENDYKITLKDITGNGIDRATNYLIKVAGVNFTKSAEWNEVKSIQKIRNIIVHNGGFLSNPDGSIKKHESEYAKLCKFLSGENEVLIHSGYLEHVLTTIDNYFKTIDLAIKEKEVA